MHFSFHAPVYFHFFGITVHSHPVMEVLGYGVGFLLFLFLRKRWPKSPALTVEQTAWIVIGALFGAVLGARVLALVEAGPEVWGHLGDPRVLLGGKTIVGAILGGWGGVQVAKRILGLSYPSGDVYVFPVMVGMCIGRVGCFLAGPDDHTVGLPTGLPWGVDFGDGVGRHPAQLYEIGFLVVLGLVFLWRIWTGRQRGCMFSQFVFGYMAWRFGVEFIKPRFLIPFTGLSPIQVTTIGGMFFTYLHRNDQCCGVVSVAGNGDKGGTPLPPGPQTLEMTTALCATCLGKVDAKVVREGNEVFLQKFCPTHGAERVLIADDAEYYLRARHLYQPPTAPLRRNTKQMRGCPYDCGLCADHEQHSCLAILEITDACDLACPLCYARSVPGAAHRTLGQIEAMLDSAVANEGHVNVIQVSGGEPTLHPDLFAVLDAVRKRPVRHLMLNTNGLRLAEDAAFAGQLAKYMPGFEVYLQFDSLRGESLRQLRGRDLTEMRRRALENLNRHGISTTLVVTLAKGVNDEEVGEILEFAVTQRCVRGVTFQPVQYAGRLAPRLDPAKDRLTLTEVRRRVLEQFPLITANDLLPVPCHPDNLAMAYALRRKGSLVPLSKLLDPTVLLSLGGNTICYEQEPRVRAHVQELANRHQLLLRLQRLFSASASPSVAAQTLNEACCAPGAMPPGGAGISYDQIFRVIIMQFMDAHSLDLRSLKRSCVHIVHPDTRLIPFETYNIFHRPEATRIAQSSISPENVALEVP